MGFSQEEVRDLWLWSNGSCLAVLENHFSVVRGLDFSVDGETMVSAGRDQVVNFWDMKTFKLKSSLPVYEVYEPKFAVLMVGIGGSGIPHGIGGSIFLYRRAAWCREDLGYHH
jgi:WD40 repeat protein